MRRVANIASGVVALALLAASGAASAQAVRPPTREELQIGDAEPATPPPRQRVTVAGEIERGPCPLADPAYAAVSVDFAKVDFTNLTAVSPTLLDPTWRDLAGREVPIASLCEIRDRAATLLRQQGYLAAVQVPPQRIDKGGTVRMDVLIARLVEVQVRGETGNAERRIAAHVAKLTKGEFFNLTSAERHLLLLGDLPGYDVRMTLRPAGKPGEVFGDILVVRRPLEVIGAIQNLGSKSAGRHGGLLQATLNDVTGLGDRTQLSVYNTFQVSEQTVAQIAHDFALGTDGWRFGGSFVYGRSEPPFEVKIKSRTLIGRIEATYPIVRRQTLTLRGIGGVELVDQRVDLAGLRVSEDRLRILYARLDLDMIDKASLGGRAGYSDNDPFWRIAGSVELRKGLGALGASRDCTPIADCTGTRVPISNFFADPRALVLRAESVLEYRPLPKLALIVAPRAQIAAKALLPYEQFSLGNYTIGRGLDPGVVQGDKGVGSSVELRFGKRSFQRARTLTLLPYGFFDAAWAWNNDDGFTADPRRVLTAGGGVRIPWRDRLEANLSLAVPLERAGTQTKRGDLRFLFTIATRLAPWKDR